MTPNVDLNNNNNDGSGNSGSQQQQQQHRRCFRFRQMKKILPSDHVTIEKNFPRFYEKCKNLKLLRDFQDRQEDQRMTHWAAVEKSFIRRHCHSLISRRSDQQQTTVDETPVRGPSSHADRDVFQLSATKTMTNKMAVPMLEIKMADHLDEMTLQSGCWLRAKSNPARGNESGQGDEAPRVVFLHRKRSPTEIRPRCQLAREVLAEFEREKRKLESRSSFFSWKLNYDHLCRRVS